MDLGLTNVADTYKYVLNQSGSAITLGDGSAVNWNAGGVVSITGNQAVNGEKYFNNLISAPNILIHNPSSDASLEILGNTNVYIDLTKFPDTDYSFRLITDGSNGTFIKTKNGPLSFQPSDTERMRINSNGNVGIGTSTPTYKLTIGDNISNVDSSIYIGSSTNITSERASIQFDTWVVGQDSLANGTKDFFFYGGTIPSQKLRISPEGQVLFAYATTGAIATSTNLQMNRYPVIQGNVSAAVTSITATVSPAGSKCTLIVSGSAAGSLAFVSPIRATGILSVASTKVSTISFVSDGNFMYEIGRAVSV